VRGRIRLLLVADSHLGLDEPARPRIERRRRGPDLLANLERALTPALRGEVDVVVHGGDLLYRSRVPPELVQRAMAPLFRVADLGVPVVLVPGNHERSRIPYPLLARHPRVHLLDRPRTLTLEPLGLALSGWPYAPEMAGGGFERLLEASGWREARAPLRVLCLHQLVEGSRVGLGSGGREHVFRHGRDVIPARAIPAGLAAVLCGHVHRAQLLRQVDGRALAAPVVYPGAVERTSFAERDEQKGYYLLELAAEGEGGQLAGARFVPLPTRPMEHLRLPAAPAEQLLDELRGRLAGLAPDAIVRVELTPSPHPPPTASRLRAAAPTTMTLELAAPRRAGAPLP